jgi:hypothetical protein
MATKKKIVKLTGSGRYALYNCINAFSHEFLSVLWHAMICFIHLLIPFSQFLMGNIPHVTLIPCRFRRKHCYHDHRLMSEVYIYSTCARDITIIPSIINNIYSLCNTQYTLCVYISLYIIFLYPNCEICEYCRWCIAKHCMLSWQYFQPCDCTLKWQPNVLAQSFSLWSCVTDY